MWDKSLLSRPECYTSRLSPCKTMLVSVLADRLNYYAEGQRTAVVHSRWSGFSGRRALSVGDLDSHRLSLSILHLRLSPQGLSWCPSSYHHVCIPARRERRQASRNLNTSSVLILLIRIWSPALAKEAGKGAIFRLSCAVYEERPQESWPSYSSHTLQFLHPRSHAIFAPFMVSLVV